MLPWRTVLPLAVLIGTVALATEAWQRYHDRQWGLTAASAVSRAGSAPSGAPAELLMLSSRTCAVCVAARRWLVAHAVPHRECFIEDDAACKDRFEQLRAVGTPVFVSGSRTMTGFRPQPFALWLSQGAAVAAGPVPLPR